MNWRSSIAPIARVTASISALTKFTVTGVDARRPEPLRDDAALPAAAGLAAAGWSGAPLLPCCPNAGAAPARPVIASAITALRRAPRQLVFSFVMIIRSR
jgi:hypothetical protein